MSDAAPKSIEDLLKAVNDASGSARALFVTLMVLALYFLIVVSGTDDMALLRNATVAVPTLSNATLPARAFYLCAPLVFVFLHLDLLIHLKLLSDKLYRFNQVLETSGLDEAVVRDWRLRLAGFPFSNWLGSDPRTGRMAHALQGAMVWLTLVLLPLTVLMAMQLGFLAYQSEAVTWLHRGALIVDAGLLLYFWHAFRGGRCRPADEVRDLLLGVVGAWLSGFFQGVRGWCLRMDRRRQCRWRFSITGRLVRSLKRAWAELLQSALVLALLVALAGLVVQLFAFGWQLRFIEFVLIGSAAAFVLAGLLPLLSLLLALFGALRQSSGDIALGAWLFVARRWPVLMPAVPLLLLSLTVATIPDEAADRTSRWLYSWMEGGTQDKPSPDGGLTSGDFDKQIFIVRASLSEGGKSKDAKTKDAKSLEKFEGARCARWLAAAMPGMPDADERLPGTARQASAPATDKAGPLEAAPEGSALEFHLENANRMPPNMRASCPTIALFHLKGGWFHRTLTVTGKVVARSDIRPELAKDLRASLREYRARAETGEGPNADLANKYDDLVAQIEGLDLNERSLRWGDFTGVALPKALLDRAQLQHAILTSSDLRKVNLGRAWLTGADMSGATLTGANMKGAKLTGADMSGATLTSAKMSFATLTGVDMSGAILTGADLGGATLIRAHLSSATLTGAYMYLADLTGARAIDTKMAGVYLSAATLTGASMSGATLTGADMSDAKLTGVDLSNVSAKGTLLPVDSEDRRWMTIGDLKTGSYDERDIEATVAELKSLAANTDEGLRAPLEGAIQRLTERIGRPTVPDRFPDCIGRAPCGDGDARQRMSALDRAAHFETLICAPATRDMGQHLDISLSLLNRLVSESCFLGSVDRHTRSAASKTLRRIMCRHCGSHSEVQVRIEELANALRVCSFLMEDSSP